MTLRKLRVRGWRNIVQAEIEPGPRATVLFGQNGQGKTNLVEAAYFLVTFRSFRTHDLGDLVRWGGDGAAVDGQLAVGPLERKLEVKVQGRRRAARLDGKTVRRDASSLQGVAAVLFVPEDLLLPRASPAERRRFLDRAIFATDRAYAAEAVAYEKVLRNRNALLRKEEALPPALLETYDDELARIGARIVTRRRALVCALAPRVTALFAAMHADLGASVSYRSHAEIQESTTATEVEAALRRGLVSRHELDARRRFTGFGPHTDDLELGLIGHLAREHGSQGQLRSLVLALKLAELAHLEEVLGQPPLLLLDDVASELDHFRRERLFETIAALPGQTIVTVTDRDLLPRFAERRDFEVRGGEVSLYT